MADEVTSKGVASVVQDVEMREGGDPVGLDAPLDTTTTSIAPASAPMASAPTEHLSTIQPAASSTATPPRPSAPPTQQPSIPPPPNAKPIPHGGPTRQYLNQNLTPHLLEGMKYIAMYEPEKPLLWLSEFLRDRSRELEGA
ncbi:hypothetical protein B0A48_14399 [Cryoendolithus antarcticus]|uniref:COMPASS component SDC1 n=1 Tax=Cryoendolithus antarcticus TaxID=1507870 RepID=A0A1V8SJV3_9PEZI|nr:hypothetical protein B0A48_14399 [Cryoendolithus antarcticus]